MFPQKTSAAASAFGYDSSREKAILENPQIFQNCEIINILSAEDAQSEAERILNCPACGQAIKKRPALPVEMRGAAWFYWIRQRYSSILPKLKSAKSSTRSVRLGATGAALSASRGA